MQDGWKLVSPCTLTPILKERPAIIMDGLSKGNYNELEFLQRAFRVEFSLEGVTISFLQILIDIINTNIEYNNNNRKSTTNNKYYKDISEGEFWKFLGLYMLENLEAVGNLKKSTAAQSINTTDTPFIGKGRSKVIFLFFFFFFNFLK